MQSRSVAHLLAVTPPCNLDIFLFPSSLLFLADGFPSRGLIIPPSFMCCVADCVTCPRPSQVLYYQSYYTFNNKYMMELHVGAAILREGIQAAEKGDDQGLKLKMAKAEQETRIKRVCSLRYEIPPCWIQLCSRQRKPSWMIARRRYSAPSVNDSSGTKRSTIELSHPLVRRKQMSEVRCNCSMWAPGGPPRCRSTHLYHENMHCRSLYITPIAVSVRCRFK